MQIWTYFFTAMLSCGTDLRSIGSSHHDKNAFRKICFRSALLSFQNQRTAQTRPKSFVLTPVSSVTTPHLNWFRPQSLIHHTTFPWRLRKLTMKVVVEAKRRRTKAIMRKGLWHWWRRSGWRRSQAGPRSESSPTGFMWLNLLVPGASLVRIHARWALGVWQALESSSCLSCHL